MWRLEWNCWSWNMEGEWIKWCTDFGPVSEEQRQDWDGAGDSTFGLKLMLKSTLGGFLTSPFNEFLLVSFLWHHNHKKLQLELKNLFRKKRKTNIQGPAMWKIRFFFFRCLLKNTSSWEIIPLWCHKGHLLSFGFILSQRMHFSEQIQQHVTDFSACTLQPSW